MGACSLVSLSCISWLKKHAVYRELYALYKKLHDVFGTKEWSGNLSDVMKQLIAIRSRVRK